MLRSLLFPAWLALASGRYGQGPPAASRPAIPLPGDTTWAVDLSDRPQDGHVKVTIEVLFADARGKKQKKRIVAEADVLAAETPIQKRDALKKAIDGALRKEENRVGGHALLRTVGVRDRTNLLPAADVRGSFADVQIENIVTLKRNKNAEVGPPSRPRALARIRLLGDVVGQNSDGVVSSVSISTDFGQVNVSSPAGNRRIDVLRQLASGLVALGATVWRDEDEFALFVLVDERVGGIGAGSDDEGLTVENRVTIEED